MHGMFFDDLYVGQSFETECEIVSEADILAFASEFDPNPFHLDKSAASRLGFPNVIASGMHTLSISMKLFFQLNLWDEAVMPSPGLNNLRWHRPVFPGTHLFVRATVSETRVSTSKPDRGIITIHQETLDKMTNTPLMSIDAMHRLKRRRAEHDTDVKSEMSDVGSGT